MAKLLWLESEMGAKGEKSNDAESFSQRKENRELVRLLIEHFENEEVMRSHTFTVMDGIVTSHSVNRIILSIGVTLAYIFVTVEITKMTS